MGRYFQNPSLTVFVGVNMNEGFVFFGSDVLVVLVSTSRYCRAHYVGQLLLVVLWEMELMC